MYESTPDAPIEDDGRTSSRREIVMALGQLNRLVQHLRRSLRGCAGDVTDGELLEAFVATADPEAFEGLVRRHGPMVLGVCQRVLRHRHDAEDAFQATFLVLARRAASVWPREQVGNFLYGVAYHTARDAQRRIARRRTREKPMRDTEPAAPAPDGWGELWPLLDQELSRLPDRYRVPIVLCDLEGRTRKEAAHLLGCPEGTISGRLSRARALLARRLGRHGLVLSAATVAATLAHGKAIALVGAPLVSATVRAATTSIATGVVSSTILSLAEGVIRAMWIHKVKTTATLLILGLIGLGAAAVTFQAQAQDKPALKAPLKKSADAAPDKEVDDAIDLPTGPAPYQSLASVNKNGQIVLRGQIVEYHQREVVDPSGVKQKYYEPVLEVKSRTCVSGGVHVYGTDGKEIEEAVWAKRLKKEIPVLVSADGQPVDRRHLRLVKEGTLVLVERPIKGKPLRLIDPTVPSLPTAPALPPAPIVEPPAGLGRPDTPTPPPAPIPGLDAIPPAPSPFPPEPSAGMILPSPQYLTHPPRLIPASDTMPPAARP
jgi:RNA polymerase sigma factor (sigma-70 family)